MSGSTESQVPKLISCEIIFAEFNPPTIQADGQTDGLIMAIPRYATLRAVKTRMIRLSYSERILIIGLCSAVFTAQCTIVERGLAIVCRLSVCPSVTLVICDHIGWKSWKLIAQSISPTPSLFLAKRRSTYSQGNI